MEYYYYITPKPDNLLFSLPSIHLYCSPSIFFLSICQSYAPKKFSWIFQYKTNLPYNCIGLANKFVSYAELEGFLVSYIAWRMKYLQNVKEENVKNIPEKNCEGGNDLKIEWK